MINQEEEKGRLAGERVSNTTITGMRTIVKWIKREPVTGVPVIVGAGVFTHPHAGYKEPKST